MDNRPQNPPAGGMALDDIYFVLFRHKWKIILLFAAGVLAAVNIYRTKPPDYQSQAKLMIKYVVDNTSPGAEGEPHMQSTDPEGMTIMNTEIEILSSLDVAKKVAEDIGPEKVLARAGGGNDLMQAAGFINGHLHVSQLPKSSVIEVDFKHPAPEMVQPILSQIISEYKKKHIEVHQPGGTYYDFFSAKTEELKNDLAHIETQLRHARTNAGVISIDGAAQEYAKAIAITGQEIRDAEADLASYTLSISQLTKVPTIGKPLTADTNTNPPAKLEPPIPAAVTEQYVRLSKRLATLWAKDEDLDRQGFLEGSTLRINNRAEIKTMETQKQKFEEENPRLKLPETQVLAAQVSSQPAQSQSADPAFSLSGQAIQMARLQNKTEYLKSKLKELQGKAETVADLQPEVAALERQKKLVEDDLLNYTKGLRTARISDALGAGKAPNITTIEEPSPPGRDWSKRYKAMGMLIVAGLGGGLAWAFLIEFYLDTSIKRSKEVKTKLGMPLFLSIPDINRNGLRRRALTNGQLQLKDSESGTAVARTNGSSAGAAKLEVAPWDPNHSLRPFYEALRDRLLGYFEARNLTHNPKLVAVTGSSKGSGATTLAMGLAASLSETGDGNVLLVDMNLEHGASQHFHKGKPTCGLDDVLEDETRKTALVQENLYVVNANSNGDRLPRILPKRFASLVPKFKASDFDYIIFDMPPISQTSVTLRLAGFMDTVLLVVESEKTGREAVLQAGSLLAEAKANVNVVLNKTRSYIPARLHQEY